MLEVKIMKNYQIVVVELVDDMVQQYSMMFAKKTKRRDELINEDRKTN